MTRPARPILVVDDDPKIVRLVRTYLEHDGFRVTEASDGKSALAAIALDPPSLVVLDLLLPEVDGLEVLRAVRRTQRTPVVMLSARGAPSDRFAGLAEGADDYITKPFSPAELTLRVRRVWERASGVGSHGQRPATHVEPMHHADLELDPERHEATVAGRAVALTAIELRLLAVIVEAGGRVLTRDQLLDAVYGPDGVDLLDRTIDARVRRIRAKLGDDPRRPRYIATVRGIGYRAAPQTPETA